MSSAVFVLFFPLITETVLSSVLTTYIVFVFGLTPRALGDFPTCMSFPIFVLFIPLITETVLST